ncbi:hypothetical protein GUJ93_ZPchr0008g11409 [Zizania palustris]|uniref:BED-type domain-containing protein n=1 Tax=Zizania palustris TaxID=103762 RepID=A0A8J5RHG7_ZIZPA|nr:hypothetical protein GUJ93_ZPchr0008g11409 [Zizania palustris]KAG8045115.1 hypothetical protein GUJ93_ZPchr0008g11409 [Zizania palustris]
MDEIPEPLSNGNEMMHGNVYTTIAHGSEMVREAETTNGGEEMVVASEITPPTTMAWRRKRKSAIWEHFTLVDVSEGCKRASCIHCNQSLAYSSGSKNSGTSHLTRHITEWCRALKDQQKRKRKGHKYNGYPNSSFDQDYSSSHLAKMIILNDYPLHIVQQPAFLSFVHSVQPNFKMADIGTLEAEVFAIYRRERDNLQQALGTIPGRMGLIVGSFMTNQALGYVSLSGQFIDSEWKLHRRMLNFMMTPYPQSGNAVSQAIGNGLPGWNMQNKLFTITLDDDCRSHDIYSATANLRNDLSTMEGIIMLKDQLFVVRCYANILNAVAHDVLALVKSTIYLIRESIKFIKANSSSEEKFHIANALCLDVTSEWNSTYLMLQAALDNRQVFTLLESCDYSYSAWPSTEDWKKADVACRFLKLLYESAQSIMAAEIPTANIFFHEAWALQLELLNATVDDDLTVRGIAVGIHERFDEYWKDCNLVLAIAVVMDPRFKMKIVEFAHSKMYGSDADKYVNVVQDAVYELYKEYVALPLPPLPPMYGYHVPANGVGVAAIETDASSSSPSSLLMGEGDELVDFDIYLSEVSMDHTFKSELDLYLEEGLIDRAQEFDILKWWQVNTRKYPTLSIMARDVLAIPVSMVGVGSSVFSAGTGSRTLDDYRSSLRPQLLEALFCAKDWLQYSSSNPQ